MPRTWGSLLDFTFDEGPVVPHREHYTEGISPYSGFNLQDHFLSFSHPDTGNSHIAERSISALRADFERREILDKPIPPESGMHIDALVQSMSRRRIAKEVDVGTRFNEMIAALTAIVTNLSTGVHFIQTSAPSLRHSEYSGINVETVDQDDNPLRTISVKYKLWFVLDSHLAEMRECIHFSRKGQKGGLAILAKV
jgi:hypothetical protein